MNELENIIAQLERQRNAIDQALEALRGMQGIGTGTSIQKKRGRPAGKKAAPQTKRGSKRRMSAEGRERIAAAARKMWANKRAADAEAAAKKATKRKRPAKKRAVKKLPRKKEPVQQ